jgi:hypothetical protein
MLAAALAAWSGAVELRTGQIWPHRIVGFCRSDVRKIGVHGVKYSAVDLGEGLPRTDLTP